MDRRNFLNGASIAIPAAGLAAVSNVAPALADGGGYRRQRFYRHVEWWMDAYLEAWRAKDGYAASRLFTTDGVYEVIPGVPEQTFVGRAAIEQYWVDITAPQLDIQTLAGRPIVFGNRASVEIWVTWRDPAVNPDGDHSVTLIETNILDFEPNGLCSRNAEYWHFQLGFLTPPPGWGNR